MSKMESKKFEGCLEAKQVTVQAGQLDQLQTSSAVETTMTQDSQLFQSNSEEDTNSSLEKEPADGQARWRLNTAGVHLEEIENSITETTDNLLRETVLTVDALAKLSKARKRGDSNDEMPDQNLLDEEELKKVLPLKEVSIHLATWNMNGKELQKIPRSWLFPEDITGVPDIIAVGTQETYPAEDDWEVMLQGTIGPSHVMYHSTNFGTLHMAVFVRRELIWFLSVPDEDTLSVRMTTFRTKGAIAVGFYLFGTTFLLITSHLTAHEEKLKQRHDDIRHIVKGLKLPHKIPCHHRGKDVTENFDYVFWSGDLNFRLTRPRSEVLDWISSTSFPLAEPALEEMGDQLASSIKDGTTLRGFEEGLLTFPPTYKFDPGTSEYDTSSKQRTPSYTDRILYKANTFGEEAVTCEGYGSVHSVCTSDHKPVWGRYKCPVRLGSDTIPLNAGRFNREVYLDAIKRRHNEKARKED